MTGFLLTAKQKLMLCINKRLYRPDKAARTSHARRPRRSGRTRDHTRIMTGPVRRLHIPGRSHGSCVGYLCSVTGKGGPEIDVIGVVVIPVRRPRTRARRYRPRSRRPRPRPRRARRRRARPWRARRRRADRRIEAYLA